MIKVGFIGFGKMASALAKAMEYQPNIEVYAYSPSIFSKDLSKEKVIPTKSILDLVSISEVIVLSFLPEQLNTIVDDEIRSFLKNKTVISVLGGVRLKQLSKLLPNVDVYQTLPNVLATTKFGTLAVERQSDKQPSILFSEVVRNWGEKYYLDENQLQVESAVAGSMPAFVAEIVDDLIKVAVKKGLTEKDAQKMIKDTFFGTLQYINDKKITPEQLINEVATPGGSTQRGIDAMRKNNQLHQLLEKTIEQTMGIN